MSGSAIGAAPCVRLERSGDIAVIVIDNPPVNASSCAVRQSLLVCIRTVENDADVQAAVIIGAGNTFVAGSDIKEFGKPLEDPQLPQIITAIQRCPKPFVAAIHGTALGGGFELALGCDARVAVPGAVIGMPEVTLGMIPGAGGTQYIPRLIGIAAAIEMICSGRRIGAKEAAHSGLIDCVIENGGLLDSAINFARALHGCKRPLDCEPPPATDPVAVERAADAALRAGRNRPQSAAAIDAVKSAAVLPVGEALARERAVFQKLRVGTEAAALRHLFFAERQAGRVLGLDGVVPRSVSHVGIVGAGTMGIGIAACFADAGFPVTVVDRDETIVEQGLARLRSTYDRMVTSKRISADQAVQRFARVRHATDLSALSDCDLIVEAVFEEMDVKTDVFGALGAISRQDAVIASNTSYLDLDRIAEAAARPDNVVGLHFFSPANVMRLLEVVRCAKTSAETLATALNIAKRLRKLAIVAQVGEGFIGNRIFAAYRRQCEFMLEEGAYPEEIDAALQAFGFAMGPFAVADLSGLDIAWRMRRRHAATRDPKERYVAIGDVLCERGRLGQKCGAGWYRYPAGERRGVPDADVHAAIEAASAAKGLARRSFCAEEICIRALIAMVNEAALVLEEEIAARASDIDLAMVHGYGFPNYEGGPLFWMRRQNREWLLIELDRVRAVSGYGYRMGKVAALYDQLTRDASAVV
jgi:3-hydroxyacyl-CoA dehydrogenase